MHSTFFEEEFAKLGAFWVHDGNPKRPYVRLSGGLISNGFFNCGKVAEENPRLLGQACDLLAAHAGMVPMAFQGEKPYLIGAAMGGIVSTFRLAEAAGARFAYSEKDSSGGLVFKRFSFKRRARFIMADDTVTTGLTFQHLEHAAQMASPDCTFEDRVLTICNRSEGCTSYRGRKIISLITKPMKTWKDGENPFTSNGCEFIEPVRPKENWDALTRAYE